MTFLRTIDVAIAQTLRYLAITGLAAILALITYGIIARKIEGASIAWADELIEPVTGWIVFLSAAALWREKSMFTVNLLERALPRRAQTGLQIVIEIVCLAFAATFLYEGFLFTATSVEEGPFLEVSKIYWYAAMPVAGLLMTAYSIRDLLLLFRYGKPLPAAPMPIPD